MSFVRPDWLTEEFLRTLLEQNQDESNKYEVELIKHDIYKRVPDGENYGGNLLGVHVDIKKLFEDGSEAVDHKCLITKSQVEGTALSSINKFGVAERESEAYYKVFPELNRIVTKEGDEPLTPKCYVNNMKGVTILEDLKTTGYIMIDKRKQMDYDLSVFTLKHLAKFHAASVKLHETQPELIDRIENPLIITDPMDPEMKSLVEPIMGETHLDMLCEEFEKYPETRKYVKFFSNLKPKLWSNFVDAKVRHDDDFNVLTHGDLHINNIQFQFDEHNNVQQLKFLDHQCIHYSCFASDLLYLIGSSVRYDVIAERFDELTEKYHEYLNFYLEKYGSKQKLGKENFRKSIEKRELMFLWTCVYSIPFMYAGHEDYSDNEEPPEVASAKYPFFEFSQTKRFRTMCVKYLELFSSRPWFKDFSE